jgi:hypothetical protein
VSTACSSPGGCRARAPRAHGDLGGSPSSCGELRVGEALALARAQQRSGQRVAAGVLTCRSSSSSETICRAAKTRVDAASARATSSGACRRAARVGGRTAAAGRRSCCPLGDAILVDPIRAGRRRSRPARPDLERAQAFCSASLKVRPIAIASPTLFICVVRVVGGRELLEGEARHLDHHVVDGRLEAGRRRRAGDVVGHLVQRVAPRPAWRRSWRWGSRWPWRPAPSSSARRAGSSRSPPCARSRDQTANWTLEPPVSTPISRMTAIEASRMLLVLLVGQRLGRRHGDRVAGVHAHRIDVLDAQTMTTLSARSRITSSSNSFQPSTDSSISTR